MTKEEFIARKVAEATKKAEAAWKREGHRMTYDVERRRIRAWSERCSGGLHSYTLFEHMVALTRRASGLSHHDRGYDADMVQRFTTCAEAFMELFDELKGGVKS